MESSKSLGVTEECSSSESGWTMYIASPVHEHKNYDVHDDDDGKGDDDDDGDNHGHDHDNDGHKSDDSMASDASSGHSYRGTLHGKRLSKKLHKQVEKKIYDKKIKGEKKEELGRKENRAGGYGYRGGKVPKNRTGSKLVFKLI